MNSEQRTAFLANLALSPEIGKINIAYKYQHVQPMPVYRINLEYLVYNQFNGRIGTLVKAHEAEFGPIKVESTEGKEQVEKFLWDSHEIYNKGTMENLEKIGQRDPGIVTLDGVIIDGNRRAFLLSKIAKKNKVPTAYFDAAILPDRMGTANIREIKRLETQYQMGLDEKLGYNANEKYLQIQALYDQKFKFDEIAGLMNLTKEDVQKFWEIKQLMDEYLEYFDYKDMYTRLDRAEDWFWHLHRNTKNMGKGKAKPLWNFLDANLNDLKLIMFDYIRTSREATGELLGDGQAFRDICSASQSGFFRHEQIWNSFAKQHFDDFDSIEEKSVDEYRASNPGVSISKLLQQRDKDFTDKVKNKVKANFGRTKNTLITENEKSEPKKLLENALAKLDAISEVDSVFLKVCESDSSIREIIRKIGKRHFEIKKVVDKLKQK